MAEREKVELKTITSLKELDIDGLEMTLDLTEDAWAYGAPPPAGVYDIKWMLAKDGIKVGRESKDDPKSVYIQIAAEGKVVNNEEWNGSVVYMYLDTRVFRGKQISTMAGFVAKAGGGKYIQGSVTPKKVAEICELVLKKEPVIKTEVEWKGSYKWTDKKGEDKYENKWNSMDEFPWTDETKTVKKHVVTVTGVDGESHEIRAQVKVVTLYGKGDTIPDKTKKKEVAPQLVQKSKVEETVMLEETKPAKGVVQAPKTAASSEDADMELLLA